MSSGKQDVATRLLRRCTPRNDNVAESCLYLSSSAEVLSELRYHQYLVAVDRATFRLLRRYAPRNDNVAESCLYLSFSAEILS